MEIIRVALAGGSFFGHACKKNQKTSAWSNSGMENRFAENVFVVANVEVRRLCCLVLAIMPYETRLVAAATDEK